MGRYTGKTARLSYMLFLTSTYFLVEIIVGYVTNSMALVADSFHMLSDVLALVIGLFSVQISKKSTSKNTFGWARAEVLGALVNAVFLLALCFSILIESIKRIIMPEGIRDPVLLIVVGGIGLLINVVGLLVLGSHGHSHGGHGHSHGGHGHSHGGHGHEENHDHDTGHGHSHGSSAVSPDGTANNELQVITPKSYDLTANHHLNTVEEISPNTRASLSEIVMSKRSSVTPKDVAEKKKKPKSSAQMNMKGVFLHVLGDALGSVVVMISAVIMWQIPCSLLPCPTAQTTDPVCDPAKQEKEKCWTLYVDPGMSIFLVAIILSTTIPLLKESALILLQTVPTHIEVEKVKKRLLEKIAGVLAVHEFHVWQLAGNRIIASAHIHCQNLSEYRRIAEDVKEFFHNEGIHSTTIQPEFVERPAEMSAETKNRDCILECKPEECRPSTCCGNKLQSKGTDQQIRHRVHNHADNPIEIAEQTLEEGKRANEPDVVEITSCTCQH